MRVGYDLTGVSAVSGGGVRVAVELRRALEALDGVELVPVSAPPAPPIRFVRGAWRELGWYSVGLPRLLRRLELDVLHCPTAGGPRRAPVPVVITAHDAMPWDRPEWFPRRLVLHTRLAVAPALRRADLVLTPSRHSGQRLVAAVGLDPGRVVVVPYGVAAPFCAGPADPARLERLGISRPYLLTVGVLQPRKNLEAVLAAFELLCADGFQHTLVVAGARGWGQQGLLERLATSPLAGRVEVMGEVSEADLVELYRGADSLVHLSLGEGFGFPPLEAMACGTPAVVASVDSLPEVVGEAGVLVPPDDPTRIALALGELLRSGARREELRAAGLARAAGFTWRRSAEATVAAYETAVSRS